MCSYIQFMGYAQWFAWIVKDLEETCLESCWANIWGSGIRTDSSKQTIVIITLAMCMLTKVCLCQRRTPVIKGMWWSSLGNDFPSGAATAHFLTFQYTFALRLFLASHLIENATSFNFGSSSRTLVGFFYHICHYIIHSVLLISSLCLSYSNATSLRGEIWFYFCCMVYYY